MNKEIKDKWVEALRSGNYKQGYGNLQTGDSYCCLGVLCEIIPELKTMNAAAQLGAVLSVDAQIHVGFVDAITRDELFDQGKLIALNDTELAPFSAIADYIETNL